MDILVIGATGAAGSRIVDEALARGHHVTAAARTPGIDVRAGVETITLDAADAGQVAQAAQGLDVVVGATRPANGDADLMLAATAGLLAGTARAGVRLVVVGGAGSLRAPDADHLVVDDARWVQPAWREIALAGVRQLALCHAHADANWTYFSPAATFAPGPRTGRYSLGGTRLLVDADGTSVISMEDAAIAILDEVERPNHRGAQFTAASLSTTPVVADSLHRDDQDR